MEPNADFCIILSRESFLILKSWDRNNKGVMLYPASLGEQPERQSGRVADAYDRVSINLRMVAAQSLEDTEEIVKRNTCRRHIGRALRLYIARALRHRDRLSHQDDECQRA